MKHDPAEDELSTHDFKGEFIRNGIRYVTYWNYGQNIPHGVIPDTIKDLRRRGAPLTGTITVEGLSDYLNKYVRGSNEVVERNN